MRVARNHGYAALAAAIMVAAYLIVSNLPSSKLEFRDRNYPRGFRTLVLDGGSSRLDPLVSLPQSGVGDAAPRPETRQICDALFRDLGSPVAGKPESRIQIATFLDYRCPYCRKLADIMSKMHDDNVRIVYKEWPILGEASLLAARYALAADRQGKYLPFHLRVMGSRFIPTMGSLEAIAAELAMDVRQLRADMNSDITTREIGRTAALAAALGFIGTPAMVVGRTIVQGEITRDQLQRLIEDERPTQAVRACNGADN